MTAKKKKKGKKGIKAHISTALQTLTALTPEIVALADCVKDEQWNRLHIRIINNRTGYNIDTGAFDYVRPIIMNGISIATPILIRKALAQVR